MLLLLLPLAFVLWLLLLLLLPVPGESAMGAYPEKALGVLRAVSTRMEEWVRDEPFSDVVMPQIAETSDGKISEEVRQIPKDEIAWLTRFWCSSECLKTGMGQYVHVVCSILGSPLTKATVTACLSVKLIQNARTALPIFCNCLEVPHS